MPRSEMCLRLKPRLDSVGVHFHTWFEPKAHVTAGLMVSFSPPGVPSQPYEKAAFRPLFSGEPYRLADSKLRIGIARTFVRVTPCGEKLLKRNFSSHFLNSLLPCFCVGFLHIGLHEDRRTFNHGLRFRETEAEDLLYNLNDCDFLFTHRSEFDVEFRFLLCCRTACRRTCDGDRLRGDTEFLFENLHELVELENSHLLPFLDELLELRGNLDCRFGGRCLCYCCFICHIFLASRCELLASRKFKARNDNYCFFWAIAFSAIANP